jgi:hypothetical protein
MNSKQRLASSAILLGALALAACASEATGTGSRAVACTVAPVPAAGGACVVAGTYTVRSTPRCPVGCSSGPSTLSGVTVTMSGKDVSFAFTGAVDHGDQTMLTGTCTLSTACECVTAGGGKTVFSQTGWVSDTLTSTTISSKDAGGAPCAIRVLWEATRN